MKNGKQNTNHRTSFFRLLTAFMLVAWTTTFSWSQIANAPCNLESPWIQGVGPGTYTNLEAKINDNVFSLLPPCAGSVSNVGNLIDGNWTSSSTWKNGNIPNASNDITNAVLIKHQVILSSSMNGNKDVKIKDTYFTIIYETLANIKFDNFKINYNDKK